MTTPTFPASDDAASRATSVVGQVPASAQPTAVVGQAPASPPGYPPGWGQDAAGGGHGGFGQPGYGPPTAYGQPAPYGQPGHGGYGPPPPGGMPGYGMQQPAPKKRGWIGWLVGGLALLLVIGVVGAFLLLSGGSTYIGVSSNRVAIPDDNAAGVTDSIIVDGSGQVQSVHVEATITHPYTCDLTVSLISPQGTEIPLADPQSCDRANPNLSVVMDSTTPGSPLAPLTGQQATGEWKLHVVDSVGVDEGAVTGWGLTVNTD
jgi:subtilisin-like proprotein convertase family protein